MRIYFGDAVLDAGFLTVPHLLIRHYAELGLTEEQVVFVQQLMAICWDATRPPRNLGEIARRMGKNIATARRYNQALNTAGLIVIREQRHASGRRERNDYDLSPLWQRLAACDPGDDSFRGRTIRPTPPRTATHLEPADHHAETRDGAHRADLRDTSAQKCASY